MIQKVKKNKNSGIKLVHVNRKLRKGLIISLSICLVILSFCIYRTETKHKYIDREKPVYSYANKAFVNYEVFLLPNEIYSENSLKEGNIYINNLIDYIDTVFKYEFKGERPGEVNGKYSITAMLQGYTSEEGEEKIIWSKKYVLQPETSFTGSDSDFAIEKRLPIKTSIYSEYLKQL